MNNFRQLAKIFKSTFHNHEVSIRRVKLPDWVSGECDKKGKKFFVTINNKSPEAEQIQTLIHEVAHMIAWDDPDDHGNKWGKAYSKVYKIYLDKFVNGPEDE